MSFANQNNLAYAVNAPSVSVFPIPIVAKRAPTTNDVAYQLGQLWIFSSSAYVLVNVASASATWLLLESSGGAGSFTTLTSTGATTLATTGASTNTFGNTTGATSVGILAGSGGINLTGAVTSANAITVTAGNITATNGNLVLGTAGNKLSIATGSNASMGTSAAMTAGSVTVATTAVTSSSIIFLTVNTPGGTQGTLSAPSASISAGVHFVINSSNASDTSTVNWLIIN